MSNSVRPHRRKPTRLHRPWDSPGKNTGVGCHFLLQCVEVKVKSLSRVRLLATPWTAAYQAPLSMGFSRQEYWSGLPLPSPINAYWNKLDQWFWIRGPVDLSQRPAKGTSKARRGDILFLPFWASTRMVPLLSYMLEDGVNVLRKYSTAKNRAWRLHGYSYDEPVSQSLHVSGIWIFFTNISM